jgi:hypothetical protein
MGKDSESMTILFFVSLWLGIGLMFGSLYFALVSPPIEVFPILVLGGGFTAIAMVVFGMFVILSNMCQLMSRLPQKIKKDGFWSLFRSEW